MKRAILKLLSNSRIRLTNNCGLGIQENRLRVCTGCLFGSGILLGHIEVPSEYVLISFPYRFCSSVFQNLSPTLEEKIALSPAAVSVIRWKEKTRHFREALLMGTLA
jgi:hypothetical protein